MEATTQEPLRYCLYARKSSEAEEKQALSIDSQIKEMLTIAQRDGLNVVDMYRESHSAKDCGQRPVYNQLLMDVREEKFNGILVWHPDRLARNAGDLGAVVDLLDQKKLVEIRTYSQRFTNNPNEKFLLMILGSQAKLENDNKSVNVKRGLRMRCEMGLWPAPAPTGYLNEKRIDRKGYIMIDPERAPVMRKMFEKMAYENWSGKKIYHWLKFELNFRSSTSNKHLTLSNVYRLLQTPLFYGSFEYPMGSGNWYTGRHEPIITRELYEKVQERLKRNRIVRGESKEFAFTRLLTCGLCGAGICAEEKFKNLRNGTVARYVYYGCNRSKDRFCKGGYVREDNLIEQMIDLADKLDMDVKAIRKKFDEEYKRMTKFQQTFLGSSAPKVEQELDTKQYVVHVLKQGSFEERRELLLTLKSKVILKNKQVFIDDRTPIPTT